MKKQLLLIVTLCSLGMAYGQTAILKLLKEYQTARGIRKEAIRKEVRRKYGRLAAQSQRRILPKIRRVGIEVADISLEPTPIKPTPTFELPPTYAEIPPTKDAPPAYEEPVVGEEPAEVPVFDLPAWDEPEDVPARRPVLAPEEEEEEAPTPAGWIRIEDLAKEEEPEPEPAPAPVPGEAPRAEEPRELTDWVEGIGDLEFKIIEEDAQLGKGGSLAIVFRKGDNEVSHRQVVIENVNPSELLNLLDLNSLSEEEKGELAQKIHNRIIGSEVIQEAGNLFARIGPIVSGLAQIADNVEPEQKASFVNFAKQFVQAMRNERERTGFPVAGLDILDRLLDSKLEELAPVEEPEVVLDVPEPGEEEVEAEEEPAALAFEVSDDNVLSVSYRGVKHNTANEGDLRNLVAALAHVSDDELTQLGMDIGAGRDDKAIIGLLKTLFDGLRTLFENNEISEAQQGKLRALAQPIVNNMAEGFPRQGRQAALDTLFEKEEDEEEKEEE